MPSKYQPRNNEKTCSICGLTKRFTSKYCRKCTLSIDRKAIKTKKCSCCKEDKDISNFNFRSVENYIYKSCCQKCEVQKRKEWKKQTCKQCGSQCATRIGICQKCRKQESYDRYSQLTVGDKIYTKHKYAKYQYIRYWARTIGKDLGWTKCCKCGYDKHFEVAHIKPISEFSEDTLLTVVNDPSNLMPLCPNCHWEFDNLKKN